MNKMIKAILSIAIIASCYSIKELRLLEIQFSSIEYHESQNLRQPAPTTGTSTKSSGTSAPTSGTSALTSGTSTKSSGTSAPTSGTSATSSETEVIIPEEIVPEVPQITMPTEIDDYSEDDESFSEIFQPNKSGYSVEKLPVTIDGDAYTNIRQLLQTNYKFIRVSTESKDNMLECSLRQKSLECEIII